MELIKNKIANEPDKATRTNFLELAKKDSRGVPMPYPVDNPVHIVKLLGGEETTRKNYKDIVEEGIMLKFLEGGQKKQYFIPTYVNDKNSENYGNFHYLYQRFANIEEGQEIEMEFVRKGKTGFVDVRPVGNKEDDIPVIDEDENYSE